MRHSFFWFTLCVLLAGGAQVPLHAQTAGVVPPATPPVDVRLTLLDAMQQELDRAMARLKLADYDAPYFMAYGLTQSEETAAFGRYGALFEGGGGKSRNLYVEVRVGDYQKDNTGGSTFDFDPNQVQNPYVTDEAPTDDDISALRQRLWLLTDDQYKNALSSFLRKKSEGVFAVDKKEKVQSFSREEVARSIDPALPFPFNQATWNDRARSLSARYKKYPELFDGQVTFGAQKVIRYFVSSEGARIITEQVLYSFSAVAMTRADDGMYLENSIHDYFQSESAIPSEEELARRIDVMVADLLALRAAPVLEPYTGPAILAPEATGVLFHESVGHRLEGERQNSDEEGQTFKGQIGSLILPTFLSIVDDPTLATFEGTPLNGYYVYDNEGIKSQRTELVKEGRLMTFLMSRTPVEGVDHSNGHGRGSGSYDPIARMGNFMVLSSNAVSDDELKRRLMEESRRQGKPYGLLIKNIEGGSTNTSAYGYQAFKGSPRMVYRVDATTGEETLVRGVEMVGTPLTVIGKVVATSNTYLVFNGFCGAESGYVPVSTIAPAMLLTEIELQRTRTENGRLPILTAPEHDKTPPAPAISPEKAPAKKKKGK